MSVAKAGVGQARGEAASAAGAEQAGEEGRERWALQTPLRAEQPGLHLAQLRREHVHRPARVVAGGGGGVGGGG